MLEKEKRTRLNFVFKTLNGQIYDNLIRPILLHRLTTYLYHVFRAPSSTSYINKFFAFQFVFLS